MPSLSRSLFAPIVIFILTIGGCCCDFDGPDETNDVREYVKTLKDWSASGLVAHFPPSVPPEAKRVRFSAYPGFLQGGAYIQLRMQLPPEAIKRIEARLKQETTHAYAGGDIFDHYNEDQKNNLPTTCFHTADDAASAVRFPDHYILYVLSAKDGGGSWNHGETCGAAVSSTANEVVYWAESW